MLPLSFSLHCTFIQLMLSGTIAAGSAVHVAVVDPMLRVDLLSISVATLLLAH